MAVNIYLDQAISSNLYKAKCNNTICVAKVFTQPNLEENDWKQIEREIAQLNTLSHPCLAKYFTVYTRPDLGRALLREFFPNNLTEYLENNSSHLTFIAQVDLSHDISSGLSYLHSNDIIHGHLTSSNVLISDAGQAKICDYGMASGSLRVLGNQRETRIHPSAKEDVLSFGILVVHILNGQQPTPIEGESSEEQRWRREIDKIDSSHPLRTMIISKCIRSRDGDHPRSEMIRVEIESIKRSQVYRELQKLADEKERLKEKAESQNDTIKLLQPLKRFIPREKWEETTPAPKQMRRSADAVTDGSKVYIRLSHVKDVLVYNLSNKQWDDALQCKYFRSALVVLHNSLIAVGGTANPADGTPCSNELIQNMSPSNNGITWMRMQHERSRCTAIVTKEQDLLIIAGGENPVGTMLTSVEVLNISTNTWSIVSPLPENRHSFSAAIANNHLYLLGGWTGTQRATRAVLRCSIERLRYPNNYPPTAKLWEELGTELPIAQATCISYHNQLLTFGGTWCHCYGCPCSTEPTRNIYKYDETNEEFDCIGSTPKGQYLCFACTIPGDKIFLAGGAEDDSTSLKDAYILSPT